MLERKVSDLRPLAAALLAGALAVALSGCASSGFLTGDTQPDAWAKHYCFDGQGSIRAGADPWAAGETMGEMQSRGLVKYGDIPEAALVELAEKGCAREGQ